MKEEDLDVRKKIIRETFNDERPIKCLTPKEDIKLDEHIHPGGDIFTTESGEFIDLEFQKGDFTEDDLVKFVEFAEGLYDKHQKHVAVYVICPDDVRVWVKECEIKSQADFTIRLAKFSENPAHQILEAIKIKLRYERRLDYDDIEVLKSLPEICKKEERKYFLKEYFRIISRI